VWPNLFSSCSLCILAHFAKLSRRTFSSLFLAHLPGIFRPKLTWYIDETAGCRHQSNQHQKGPHLPHMSSHLRHQSSHLQHLSSQLQHMSSWPLDQGPHPVKCKDLKPLFFRGDPLITTIMSSRTAFVLLQSPICLSSSIGGRTELLSSSSLFLVPLRGLSVVCGIFQFVIYWKSVRKRWLDTTVDASCTQGCRDQKNVLPFGELISFGVFLYTAKCRIYLSMHRKV